MEKERELPLEKQQEVLNFADFLHQKVTPKRLPLLDTPTAKNRSSASECLISGAIATFGLENKASISSIETPCFWHF
jgi:hypothetical protein